MFYGAATVVTATDLSDASSIFARKTPPSELQRSIAA